MMGAKVDDNCESKNSTPKLSLSKLPCNKPREPLVQLLLTPPLHPSLSIPFRWEEAPGKPRGGAAAEVVVEGAAQPPPPSNKVARCLDLPPRMIDRAKITEMPSPETVLDGPYVGRSLSLACTFSFRKARVVAGREEGIGAAKKGGSSRWGSFKEEEMSCGGDFDISRRSSLGEILKSEKNVKFTRVRRRRRSFFNLSTVNSNLVDIYASLKGAVPWRRRR